jgi:hypothetical protein
MKEQSIVIGFVNFLKERDERIDLSRHARGIADHLWC